MSCRNKIVSNCFNPLHTLQHPCSKDKIICVQQLPQEPTLHSLLEKKKKKICLFKVKTLDITMSTYLS